MINQDQLKYWTTGPIIAFDENNKFYYFKDSREFVSVENFEKVYNVKLQAALGNKPRLIEEGKNLLIEWDIDEKQRNTKSTRNALAYKNDKIYLVVARNATVPDLADIMKAMAVEYALNLDGGYSSALWYNDEYMVKPGRDITNAILFSEK
jgi:exopolysaccharide biosynthesis protein